MLSPAISLTLGNLKYDSHVTRVDAELGLLPDVNRVVIELPADVEVSVSTGDDASIDLLSDAEMTRVLTGNVGVVQRHLFTTKVVLCDAGHALARVRVASTHTEQNADKIIQSLTDEAGIDVGAVEADLPLAAYVVHQNRSTAEHIATLSRLSGSIAHVNSQNQLNVKKRPSGQADLALLYGRDFTHYQVSEIQTPGDQLTLVGNGPAGNPSEPGALRQSLTVLPSSAGAAAANNRRVPAGLGKTPSAASLISASVNTARLATNTQLHADCILSPQLRPGQVLQIQGLRGGISDGPWLLKSVSHSLHGNTGQTRVLAELAEVDALNLAALAGAALGAVGGLL